MNRWRRDWLFRCSNCGMRLSTLRPRAGEDTTPTIDESHRAEALEPLRRANFARVVAMLQRHTRPGGRVLDVGCAHGWFLDEAKRAGFDVEGIEPDERIATLARARSHRVTSGFFPGDLDQTVRYDAIVFNDAFEHFPDVRATLTAVVERLAPTGLLVLNLPSSTGVFYRLAEILDRIGRGAALDRMWQLQFPSPHITYARPEHLVRLAERAGLTPVFVDSLPSVKLRGLWSRLRYDRTSSVASSVLTWLGVAATAPVIHLLPADIALLGFKRA